MIHSREHEGIVFGASPWPPESGRATLVFVHGAGLSGALWNTQLEAFADVANTLVVDLPGHGMSKAPGRRSIEEYATAIYELLEALAIPSPIGVGLSMGGAIVQQLLLDHRLCGGVLVSTGAKLPVNPAIPWLARNGYGAYLALFAEVALAPGANRTHFAPLLADMRGTDCEIVVGDFAACAGFDVRGRLAEIDLPTLVVVGAEDNLIPPRFSDTLFDGIPGSDWVRIPRAGHLLPLEQPAVFNAHVRRFVTEHMHKHSALP